MTRSIMDFDLLEDAHESENSKSKDAGENSWDANGAQR